MLAAVRCLGAAGFEVTAVGNGPTAPGLWSRFVAARRLAPDPRRRVDGFIARLEAILSAERHDVLLPGADASLLAVSQHRDRLAPYVRLGLPRHDIVERALDKGHLASEAVHVGLDAPETRVCSRIEDAREAARSFGYPVVVKPLHTAVEQDGVIRRFGSVLAREGNGVEVAARTFGPCLVQRRIDGHIVSFGGVAAERRLLGFVVSRYLRTWPPDGGNVSFSETISCPPGLAERVAGLVDRLGWEGLFELELVERGNGAFAAIDFNPRAYGSLSLAVAAGVPLPALWCRWLAGEDPAPCAPQLSGRYRWEDADVRHVAQWFRNRRSGSPLEVLRPRRGVTHAYFRRRDPVPLIARGFQLVGAAALRAPDAIGKAFRTRT